RHACLRRRLTSNNWWPALLALLWPVLRRRGWGRRNGGLGRPVTRLGFELANCLLKQQALAGDFCFGQRRCYSTELNHQSPSRTRVKRRTPVLVGALAGTGHGAGDEFVVIGHPRRGLFMGNARVSNCGLVRQPPKPTR